MKKWMMKCKRKQRSHCTNHLKWNMAVREEQLMIEMRIHSVRRSHCSLNNLSCHWSLTETQTSSLVETFRTHGLGIMLISSHKWQILILSSPSRSKMTWWVDSAKRSRRSPRTIWRLLMTTLRQPSPSKTMDKRSTTIATEDVLMEVMLTGSQTSTTRNSNGQASKNKLKKINSGPMKDMKSQFRKHPSKVQMITHQQIHLTRAMPNITTSQVAITSHRNN